MSLIDRAKKFANGVRIVTDWLGSGGETVHPNLAQTRADVCVRCPQHTSGWKLLESSAQAIKEQVGIKSKLQLRVKGEKSLHFCSVCGCAMKLKVWLPIGRIKPHDDEIDKFPLHCWLRKEHV